MSPPRKSSRKAFSQIVSEQIQPPFRGEIWEFFQNTAMVRGFANEGRPFDIESAAYLKEPMRGIRRRPHGKFVIKAAVQMLKTNGMIEQPSGYFIANDPGDMVIYLSGDFTAFDQAKARAMPYLKSNPKIAKMIDAVREQGPEGRHQITTSEFYLPGMVLRIWPLNITTTQRMTLRYVFFRRIPFTENGTHQGSHRQDDAAQHAPVEGLQDHSGKPGERGRRRFRRRMAHN